MNLAKATCSYAFCKNQFDCKYLGIYYDGLKSITQCLKQLEVFKAPLSFKLSEEVVLLSTFSSRMFLDFSSSIS